MTHEQIEIAASFMNNEYYPEESELEFIKTWDVHNVMNLLSYLEARWWCADWGFEMNYGRDPIHDKKYPIIKLKLHTGGWSGNELLIDALLSNQMFKMMWYCQWNRGGHYRFEIDLYNVGYKSANELAKEKGISRQAIHKSKEYERIQIAPRHILFRPKSSRLEKPEML